ncbi:MAG: M20/M25/M40 family metallo-hydrolase, partial [Terriglobales bacterium]
MISKSSFSRDYFCWLLTVMMVGCMWFNQDAFAQTPPTANPSASPSTTPSTPKTTRSPRLPRKDADPAIAAALKNISAANIKAIIEKLASFHNRNTLSANDPQLLAKGQGIVAARDWIKSELEKYSKACGGCLEVKLDTFTEQPMNRIPQLTELSNVYAVMRGTSDQSPQPIFLVTGHYDSRNSDTLNITDGAPGANDDASGTAVSLECARVLSKMRFPATIIFMAVAGEEQGLNGARHFAKMAKAEGWAISGVLNNDIVGGNKAKDQDPAIVRVFSEGIPLAATEAEMRTIRNLALESDSASRQLARYVREIGAKYVAPPFQAKMIFRRDRFLRGGDHTGFNESGFA